MGHEWVAGPVPGMCAGWQGTTCVVLQRPDGPRRHLRPVESARDRGEWAGWGGGALLETGSPPGI